MNSKFCKFFLSILIFALYALAIAQAETDSSQYRYISFDELIDSYKKYEQEVVDDVLSDKKIRLNNEQTKYFNRIYYIPPRQYVSQIRYLGQFQPLSKYNKEFLIDWNNTKMLKRFDISENKVKKEESEKGLENFYEELLIAYSREVRWTPIQKIVAEDLRRKLPGTATQYINIHFLTIGRFNSQMPVMIITGYDIPSRIRKEEREKAEYEITYDEIADLLKSDLQSGKRRALLKIEALQRKYPDNKNIKVDVCRLTYIDGNLANAIRCYQNLLSQNIKTFDVYYGLGSTLYYSNLASKNRIIFEQVIANLNEAVKLYANSKDDQALFNALFLRASAKMEIADKTAIDDWEKIAKIRPDLISENAIEIAKQKLGVQ